jgi:radical SAM superfamily enzyme YgiQ (UPF0313 family)
MDRKLKFLLINPAAPQWRVNPGQRPLLATRIFRFSMLTSLRIIAAMPSSVESRILDEEVESVDFGADADLIGISLMTFNAPRAYEIADRFRKDYGKTVILGGYHPTFMPDEAIMHADAVCIGEAEPVIGRMVEDFLAGNLQRFYRSGLADLALLRPLDRNLVKQSRYSPVGTIQATRGCRQRCTFCSIASFFGHQYRTRPVNQVVDELQSLGRQILFLDDNLIAEVEYARDLFAAMIPLKKRWYSQCSIGIAEDEELLDLAVRSGCGGLFIGFESLSQDNLRAWKKTFTRARDYERAIQRLHAAGIAVYAGIVFGYDWDSTDVFRNTLEFLLKANVDVLQATILTPFPGTPLFASMDQESRITDKDWSHYDFRHVVFEPKAMSPETLQAGHDWVLAQYYSLPHVLSRLRNELSYLPFSTLLLASGPLNYGYRRRLKRDGTWRITAPPAGLPVTVPRKDGTIVAVQ